MAARPRRSGVLRSGVRRIGALAAALAIVIAQPGAGAVTGSAPGEGPGAQAGVTPGNVNAYPSWASSTPAHSGAAAAAAAGAAAAVRGTLPLTAQAIPDAPGVTERVSLGADQSEGNAHSGGPPPLVAAGGLVMTRGSEAMSADGRWVAFSSFATNLVSGDTNNTADIFLRDRVNNTTQRIPFLKGAQTPADDAAAEPSISADGSVVAFTVFVKGDPTHAIGVFWWSAKTGETRPGSVDDGVTFPATQPSISPDGRFLAYVRPGLRLPSTDVWVQDLQTGNGVRETTVGSRVTLGRSSAPSISRDGLFLAFQTDLQLAADDTNKQIDIYLEDRTAHTFRRLTVGTGPAGADVDGPSTDPSINDDGSVVAFGSLATTLTPDPTTQGVNQIYVWDQASGSIRRVSLDQGSHVNDASFNAAVSADGNYVGFWSAPPYIPPPPTSTVTTPVPGILVSGGPGDVFLRDLRRDLTTRISVNTAGSEVKGDSLYPSVSSDGMLTAFGSTAPDLVGDDTNGFGDVFVRGLVPAADVTPTSLDFGTKVLGTLGGPLAVTLTSTGWPALDVKTVAITGANAGDFRVATSTCPGVNLVQGATCTVQVTFKPTATGARTATLQITDTSQTSPHGVQLTGAAGKLSITLSPTIGPPGIVTVVSASGFPPGGKVALQWDPGITAKMAPVVVDAQGRFSVGMLVFYHDLIGPRKLVVIDVGGGSFPTTTVDFLVVTPTAQPPALGPFRFLPANAKPIINRH